MASFFGENANSFYLRPAAVTEWVSELGGVVPPTPTCSCWCSLPFICPTLRASPAAPLAATSSANCALRALFPSCNLSVLTAQEMFCLEWQREPFIQVQILPVTVGGGADKATVCKSVSSWGELVRLFERSASATDVLSCAALEMLYE